jgi:hypothetical protein
MWVQWVGEFSRIEEGTRFADSNSTLDNQLFG